MVELKQHEIDMLRRVFRGTVQRPVRVADAESLDALERKKLIRIDYQEGGADYDLTLEGHKVLDELNQQPEPPYAIQRTHAELLNLPGLPLIDRLVLAEEDSLYHVRVRFVENLTDGMVELIEISTQMSVHAYTGNLMLLILPEHMRTPMQLRTISRSGGSSRRIILPEHMPLQPLFPSDAPDPDTEPLPFIQRYADIVEFPCVCARCGLQFMDRFSGVDSRRRESWDDDYVWRYGTGDNVLCHFCLRSKSDSKRDTQELTPVDISAHDYIAELESQLHDAQAVIEELKQANARLMALKNEGVLMGLREVGAQRDENKRLRLELQEAWDRLYEYEVAPMLSQTIVYPLPMYSDRDKPSPMDRDVMAMTAEGWKPVVDAFPVEGIGGCRIMHVVRFEKRNVTPRTERVLVREADDSEAAHIPVGVDTSIPQYLQAILTPTESIEVVDD